MFPFFDLAATTCAVPPPFLPLPLVGAGDVVDCRALIFGQRK
jgi:hypothetical protein